MGPQGHGPVRYGPPLPEHGLPVPAMPSAAAADDVTPEPVGGGPALLDAARGYWARRGLAAERDHVAGAPGAPVLLLALTAAVGGDVLLPRPCSAWWTPQPRLLGRSAYHVGTPAECGGVPDAYALLETVRRVRAEGGDPRLLVLSVADDPTATVAPPEVLHETVEAAVAEGLHIVSDETWRDTLHRPPPEQRSGRARGVAPSPVVLSPAEMWPERVTVLTDLAGAFLPRGWPVAVARFPGTDEGRALRAQVLDVLTAAGGRIATPVAAAATHALGEPDDVTAWRDAAVRLHARVAAAAHHALLTAGALARPPACGRHLYADLAPFRSALGALGVTDAQELEDFLTDRLGMPTPGGHRFGDDLAALRVRLSTGPLLGATQEQRAASLAAPDPLELPHVAEALDWFGSALDDLRAGVRRYWPAGPS
ncbi:pyridoxal phosphate-dependent aminotransferase [Streptomyces sp. NPDC002004]